MNGRETKRLVHWGWVTGERRMLRELGEQAKEGWFLRRCTMYHLILEKDDPKEIQYAVDLPPIKKEEEGEYLRYFEEAGWRLACKNGCFYIFRAERDAAPIHTDRALLDQIRKRRLKRMVPLTILFLILTVGFIVFSRIPMSLPQEIVYVLSAAVSGGLLGLFGTICAALLHIRNNF